MQEDFSLKGFVLHVVWLSRVYWLLCICTWDYARREMDALITILWMESSKKKSILPWIKNQPTQPDSDFQYFQPFCFQLLLILLLKASKVETLDLSLHHHSFCLFFSTQICMQKKIDKFSSATRSVLFSLFFEENACEMDGRIAFYRNAKLCYFFMSLARCHPR